jgi:hypothetical protein
MNVTGYRICMANILSKGFSGLLTCQKVQLQSLVYFIKLYEYLTTYIYLNCKLIQVQIFKCLWDVAILQS